VIRKSIDRPAPEIVEACRGIPTTILSDMMNRMNAMQAAIKPVRQGVWFAGPAVTVKCMAGDNIMSHHAIYLAQRGDVLVIDGRSHSDTAIWGGIQTLAAGLRGVAGVVVDGAIRDLEDSRNAAIAICCRAVTPAGPHKGWGGSVNEPVACGGVVVHPGDLVVGDDDGVVVIPRLDAALVLERARKRLREEQEWIRRVQAGESTVGILGFDEKLKQLGVEYK
jgi:4-hydroxy-4-methyl-2-oxoglutarate aldolase